MTMQAGLKDSVKQAQAAGVPLPYFDKRMQSKQHCPNRALSASPFVVHSGEIAGRYGIYNLPFGTVLDLYKTWARQTIFHRLCESRMSNPK